MLYLHIYSKSDGQKIFNASTRFDLYVIQNKPITKATHVIDEKGEKKSINLLGWSFLPNYEYDNIEKIITTEERGIKVIYSRSLYGAEKIKPKDKTYKWPVVYSINKDGLLLLYTDNNKKGHFGIPKVLLSINEKQYNFKEQNDYSGIYALSNNAFGIPIKSKKEGVDIVRAINSDEFKEIIKATKWGAFQTDWRMFKYFKPDFYKHFLGKGKSKPSNDEPEPEPENEVKGPGPKQTKSSLKLELKSIDPPEEDHISLGAPRPKKSKSKSKSPKPKKTIKKSICPSKLHPPIPCKPGMYNKDNKGCCYKDPKTKKKKGGHRHRRNKRSRRKSRKRK